MREARRNRASRQSVRGKYGINPFGSISACSRIVFHYCDVLKILKKKKKEKMQRKRRWWCKKLFRQRLQYMGEPTHERCECRISW